MITATSLSCAARELAVAERRLAGLVADVDSRLARLRDTNADSSTWWTGPRADRFRSGNDELGRTATPVVPAVAAAIVQIGRLRGIAVELAAELRAVEAARAAATDRLHRVRGRDDHGTAGDHGERGLVAVITEHDRRRHLLWMRWVTEAAAITRAVRSTAESLPSMALMGLGGPSTRLGQLLESGSSDLALGDPLAVAAWWASLPSATRTALVATAPWAIGNLDGIPFDVRIDANRRVMQATLDASEPGSTDWNELHQFVAADHRGRIDSTRQFLVFDMEGDGRLVEVFGELDSAVHIAVMVPGMGSTLAGFADHAGRGRRLHAAGGRETAVIAWTGYDAPHALAPTTELLEVVSGDQADVGGRLLHGFVDGLRAHTDGSITLIGNSYGSLTVGRSLHDGASVDRVVFMGSPGVGADHVGEFPSGAADAYFASEIKGDVVANLEHFGENPVDPDFGAFVFDSGDGDGLDPISRHGEYYDEGVAIDNLATIVTGGRPTAGRTDVVEYVTEPLEDVGQALNESIDRIQAIDIPLIDDRYIDRPIDVAQAVEQALAQGGEIVIEELGHFGQDVVEWGVEEVGGWFR